LVSSAIGEVTFFALMSSRVRCSALLHAFATSNSSFMKDQFAFSPLIASSNYRDIETVKQCMHD
jgi:hypothetical protein